VIDVADVELREAVAARDEGDLAARSEDGAGVAECVDEGRGTRGDLGVSRALAGVELGGGDDPTAV
jgi:hypothetical protein